MIADSVAFLLARASACCSTPSTSSTASPSTPATLWTACVRLPTRAPSASSCATPTAARCPRRFASRCAVVREALGERALLGHPHPRRLGLRRCEHARRRGIGRDAGAGNDQRHRRAHRQRQPDHDHRRPAAEDGLRAACPGASRAAGRDRALRRRAAQPRARTRRSPMSASTPSRTRRDCTPPACARTPRPSSTSTRRSSATRRRAHLRAIRPRHDLEKAGQAGLATDDAFAQRVVERVKELEHSGFQFEAADGSFELLMRKEAG